MYRIAVPSISFHIDRIMSRPVNHRTRCQNLFPLLPGWWVLASMLAATCPRASASNDTSDIEFFESRIRPLLAAHCYECHSVRENTSKGDLTLDTREGVLKGGQSGPVLVP